MNPSEVIQQLFGNYLSRTEENLMKRCVEIGWGEKGWEKIKRRGWVKQMEGKLQGVTYKLNHFERICSSALQKMENDLSN